MPNCHYYRRLKMPNPFVLGPLSRYQARFGRDFYLHDIVPSMSHRDQLLSILAEKSFALGQFKLSSGGTSDYYIDCRVTTLSARGARLTGAVFLEEILNRGWSPQAIGGLTMGADPIVTAVSIASLSGGDEPVEGFL